MDIKTSRAWWKLWNLLKFLAMAQVKDSQIGKHKDAGVVHSCLDLNRQQLDSLNMASYSFSKEIS